MAIVDSVPFKGTQGKIRNSGVTSQVLDEHYRIARRIRDIRVVKGWRQIDVKEVCGIGQEHLSRLENNQRTVTLMLLLRLCRGMKVTLGFMVGDSAVTVDSLVEQELKNKGVRDEV